MRPHRQGLPALALQILALALVYVVVGLLVREQAGSSRTLSVLWPVPGLTLAALLLYGVRLWPGIVLGSLLYGSLSGYTLTSSLIIGLANVLSSVLGVVLLRRVVRFRNRLDRVRDVLGLAALGAVVSTWPGILLGNAGYFLFDGFPWDIFGSSCLRWWLGSAQSKLLLTPLLLTWLSPPRPRWSRRRLLEGALMGALLLVTTELSFSGYLAGPAFLGSVVYAVFPVVLWASFRFGPRGAALSSFTVALLAFQHSLHGEGPFGLDGSLDQLLHLSAFLGTLALSALLLAAASRERQHALEQSQLSETRFRRLFEEALTGDFVARPDGQLLSCNRAFVRLFGFPGEAQALSANLFDLLRLPEGEEDLTERLRVQGSLQFDGLELVRPDGSRVLSVGNLVGISGSHGDLKAIQGYLLDLSQRKLLEEDLLQSQKMEAVGRLAGGIAHDFNNLLTAIDSYAEVLKSNLGHEPASRQDAEEIQKAVEQGASLTRQLLAFGRPEMVQPRIVDLNAVVNETRTLLERFLGEDIALRCEPSAAPALTRVDPHSLKQVLLNLAANARDAMPEGGQLRLQIDGVADDRDEGPFVRLTVGDTGTGMDENTRRRIFEPFFTTKGVGEGTGLGLSTVYSIIKQAGGRLQVDSEPGRGTTLRIDLPRIEEGTADDGSDTTWNGVLGGRETVLLVEDEERVRGPLRRVLEAYGYRVLLAANGDEALSIARHHEGGIDVLLTDLVMPGMNGLRLAKRLKTERPGLRILTMTGYPPPENGDGESTYPCLRKPFSAEELARSIRQALGRASL